MLDLKIKLECTLCETRIWEPAGSKLRKTPEYNEVVVNLSDQSRMKVGVCSKHTSPDESQLKLIREKNLAGWMEEIKLGVGNEKWVREKGSKLEIVGIA